ncbi:hypothetical protein EV644_11543 [Kribbella orskensis]|uniref:Phage integrase central domain-containing protein n=1 Tax=Kribbella orskensis TaxID=2512216 RepID=A0ABY2BDG1_9ACTN|nr:hypothetical protein EV642_11643 [Kribbella sp. VKM Ac-2500]TCO17023.1 hypothetical protein EV644_11543 [Kribbella orskensis]
MLADSVHGCVARRWQDPARVCVRQEHDGRRDQPAEEAQGPSPGQSSERADRNAPHPAGDRNLGGKFAELVAGGQRSPSSLDTYRRSIRNHVLPALGEVRIGEATMPRIDSVISEIKKRASAPTARTCRSIISGVMGLAVRYGALTVIPVREVDRIEHNAKKLPRALTAEEVQLLRKHLRTDERAVHAGLPDLVTFMLGTGVRIGEALAVLWSEADLDTGKVKITHTIVRVKGDGLLRKTTKSRAGQRELGLPDWPLAILRVRFAAGIRLDEPDLRRHTRRIPRPLQRAPLPTRGPLPCRQHRSSGPRPLAPSRPPRIRHHSQGRRPDAGMAPDQDRAHRDRPHQGRPRGGYYPPARLRHPTRDVHSSPRAGRRGRRASTLRHPGLDHFPRLPQTTATVLDNDGWSGSRRSDRPRSGRVPARRR